MRIAEYKQISEKTISSKIQVNDYDSEGNIIGQHEETVEKTVPVMGMVYRDMTEEEVAAFEQEQAQLPESEPTVEDRISTIESHAAEQDLTMDDMVLLLADLIGGT